MPVLPDMVVCAVGLFDGGLCVVVAVGVVGVAVGHGPGLHVGLTEDAVEDGAAHVHSAGDEEDDLPLLSGLLPNTGMKGRQ